jgi:hypothetical protein
MARCKGVLHSIYRDAKAISLRGMTDGPTYRLAAKWARLDRNRPKCRQGVKQLLNFFRRAPFARRHERENMTDISQIEGILTATSKAGAPEYVQHCGAMLEELGDLLAEGATEEAGWAIVIHSTIYPQDRRTLANKLPALVMHRYWFECLGLTQPQIDDWRDANCHWAEAIRRCATCPPRLTGLIDAQARQIASLTS